MCVTQNLITSLHLVCEDLISFLKWKVRYVLSEKGKVIFGQPRGSFVDSDFSVGSFVSFATRKSSSHKVCSEKKHQTKSRTPNQNQLWLSSTHFSSPEHPLSSETLSTLKSSWSCRGRKRPVTTTDWSFTQTLANKAFCKVRVPETKMLFSLVVLTMTAVTISCLQSGFAKNQAQLSSSTPAPRHPNCWQKPQNTASPLPSPNTANRNQTSIKMQKMKFGPPRDSRSKARCPARGPGPSQTRQCQNPAPLFKKGVEIEYSKLPARKKSSSNSPPSKPQHFFTSDCYKPPQPKIKKAPM